MTDDRSLVVLVLDPDGRTSAVARSVRKDGHSVMTVTGLDTALVVLGGLTPDLVLVRSLTPDDDARIVSRLAAAFPTVPTRVVRVADEGLVDAASPN